MANRLKLITALSLFSFSSAAPAVTLTSGSATFNYSKVAWSTLAGGLDAPGFEALVLDEYFDQAAANARTSAQILADEVQANPSYVGLVSLMNGSSVVNLTGRTAQATTFDYSPGSVTSHTGAIGLGGVTRWAANPLLGGGKLAAGDYTLAYDVSRQLVGGSGWALTNNILPITVVFDLVNVTATGTASGVSVSGDMALSFEIANFLIGSPSDTGKVMGTFSFSGTTVPEPTAGLLALASAGLALRRRR